MLMSIADNLDRVQDAVAAACRKAGRPREEVRLMAVSKTHPVELLLEAAAAGQRLFGENRVQESAAKTRTLEGVGYAVEGLAQDVDPRLGQQDSRLGHQVTPRLGQLDSKLGQLALHMIGHVQGNKAGLAAEVFSSVDTVDSLKLAERLHAAAEKAGRVLPVLLEIKLSPEETKDGLTPEDPALEALLARLPDLHAHLPLRGLMTVAPISDDSEVARACFRRLRGLREEWAQQYPRLGFEELSMGMSGDFVVAIEEGSTTVRIGTAIFGARPRVSQATAG